MTRKQNGKEKKIICCQRSPDDEVSAFGAKINTDAKFIHWEPLTDPSPAREKE